MRNDGLNAATFGKRKFATDLKTLRQEVEIHYYKSSGPGGQRKNKTETSVRLRHLPSGIMVIATEHRFQAQNKKLAFERLQKRLRELNKEEKVRVPTSMPQKLKEEILEEKRRHSVKKNLRKKI